MASNKLTVQLCTHRKVLCSYAEDRNLAFQRFFFLKLENPHSYSSVESISCIKLGNKFLALKGCEHSSSRDGLDFKQVDEKSCKSLFTSLIFNMPSKCAPQPHSSGFSLLTQYLVFFKLQEKKQQQQPRNKPCCTHIPVHAGLHGCVIFSANCLQTSWKTERFLS